ncbi:MAG: GAF domain-containing protein [Chloroflexota bacterium]|nr:GAF domain-containing protein [Chloroflexota bacterium]
MAPKAVSSRTNARAVGEPDLEQLRQENVELRAALAARSQEHILLNEIISAVGSTLKLDEILRHLVDIVVRAISCHAAFIYLYDTEKERLVLASTTEQFQRHLGKIELALGEGITGWVALALEPVILKEDAMQDPRFHYIPELQEDKFQSLMTVPIMAKDRHLIGVITMHTAAPYIFTEEHQQFVSNTAALVAGAIENAQLYENTQRKLRVLASLSVLSQTISSGLYLDDMLRSLATLTVQIMGADLCVIMLMEQARGRLTVRATSPTLNERALDELHIDVDRQALRDYDAHGQLPEAEMQALERFNPLKDGRQKTLLSMPLIAGTEHLGLLNCYFRKNRRPTSEDQTLLSTIANQAAMAIKNSHLVDMLAQKNLVKGFFDDLLNGSYDSEDALRQRANFLGCDLAKPHTVAMIALAPCDDKSDLDPALVTEDERLAAHKHACSQVRRRIQDSYPGSLVYEQEHTLTCIVCLSKDPNGSRLKIWLRDLARQIRIEQRMRLSIGVGNVCQSINEYRRGGAEASEALHMGQSLEHDGGVTHFNDLGVYRYLYKIARMDDLRDMYQEQIARIATYDHRKGTDLLDTLETYLECAGNLTRTSTRLFVHRNTLIQRLERLQSLCEIDLQERSNWLTLQVAMKVYKLRTNAV